MNFFSRVSAIMTVYDEKWQVKPPACQSFPNPTGSTISCFTSDLYCVMFTGLNIISHVYLALSDQNVRGQGCLASIKASSNLSAYSQITYNAHNTRVVESVR